MICYTGNIMQSSRADIIDVRARDDGYTAVIAVNDSVGGGGRSVDLSGMDITTYMRNPVVLWSHERNEPPIGRTTDLRRNKAGRIEADFEFAPNDQRSQALRNLWDRGFLRGASIGWRYTEEGRPELIEWSLVSVPADRDAVRAAVGLLDDDRSNSMDNDELKQLIAAAISEQAEKFGAEISAIHKSIAALTPVPEDPAESGEPVVRAAPKAPEPSDVTIRYEAAKRIALLQRAMPLMPDNMDTIRMTDREILLTAIGDELPNADQQSTDYLHATLDSIINRRQSAASQQTTPSPIMKPYSGNYSSGTAILLKRLHEEG